MWVALCHQLLSRMAVGIEIIEPNSVDRRSAAKIAVNRAVDDALGIVDAEIGIRLPPLGVCEAAVGLVLTSGSGHVAAAVGGVDFRDCYGLGQGLLAAAKELNLVTIGGCASNRRPYQSQCLYYSIPETEHRQTYQATYQYGAIVAIVPAARVLVQLDHPYKRISSDTLTLDFSAHEQYEEGKYFCVRSIDGRSPREFLQEYWTEISADEFQEMVDGGEPIPAKPAAHYFSIASSSDRNPRSIWPNIPIYFEKVGDEVLLRLVRAEAEDAYFYPIRMDYKGLIENAEELRDALSVNGHTGDSLVTFLCESRKYVLEALDSNAEVENLAEAIPPEGNVFGVYLNGEYSTGQERSIGYHNYSQMGMMFGDRKSSDLPPGWSRALDS